MDWVPTVIRHHISERLKTQLKVRGQRLNSRGHSTHLLLTRRIYTFLSPTKAD
jgi:hypothetical protein